MVRVLHPARVEHELGVAAPDLQRLVAPARRLGLIFLGEILRALTHQGGVGEAAGRVARDQQAGGLVGLADGEREAARCGGHEAPPTSALSLRNASLVMITGL